MAEFLNFLARNAAMFWSFLFHQKCCHRFVTWPSLMLWITNFEFQIVLSFLFFSSYEETYPKVCVCKIEETHCLTTFSKSVHTQKSGNWHLFLPVHILWFSTFSFWKRCGKPAWSILRYYAPQTPASVFTAILSYFFSETVSRSLKWGHLLSCLPHFIVIICFKTA